MGDVKIKDIKKGDRFWEKWLEFVALEDAYRKDGGWTVLAQRYDDPLATYTRFFVADGFDHYGPDLYSEQAYIKVNTNE